MLNGSDTDISWQNNAREHYCLMTKDKETDRPVKKHTSDCHYMSDAVQLVEVMRDKFHHLSALLFGPISCSELSKQLAQNVTE